MTGWVRCDINKGDMKSVGICNAYRVWNNK